jgi:hypothetical protein
VAPKFLIELILRSLIFTSYRSEDDCWIDLMQSGSLLK